MGARAEKSVWLKALTDTVDGDGDDDFQLGRGKIRSLGSRFPASATETLLWRINLGTTRKGIPAFSFTARGFHRGRE